MRRLGHSCNQTPISTTAPSPAPPSLNSLSSPAGHFNFHGYFAEHLHRLHSHSDSHIHHQHHLKVNPLTMSDDAALPKLFITADTNEFDKGELLKWEAEGYEVQYIPSATTTALEHLVESMESDEKYCIIAYGTAATMALDYATSPVIGLAALIAYYPTGIPTRELSPQIQRIMIHLSDAQPFGPTGKKVKVRAYQDTKPGFAEKSSIHYNATAASLGYTRTLGVLRECVGPEVDLEEIWGEHLLYEFVEKDVDKTMDTMVKEPYVNHIPTLTGGIGYTDLHRFYKDFFIPNNPPTLRLRLISRTVGTDRIVDEMICAFRHTQEIPWMLPGVPPTNREVEVPLVSIVCVRGKKLYHEHIHWDQASVLKQIGAVDFGNLPVAGPESAWKVENKDSVASNLMIPAWNAKA